MTVLAWDLFFGEIYLCSHSEQKLLTLFEHSVQISNSISCLIYECKLNRLSYEKGSIPTFFLQYTRIGVILLYNCEHFVTQVQMP